MTTSNGLLRYIQKQPTEVLCKKKVFFKNAFATEHLWATASVHNSSKVIWQSFPSIENPAFPEVARVRKNEQE